jgi:hypothetical protein
MVAAVEAASAEVGSVASASLRGSGLGWTPAEGSTRRDERSWHVEVVARSAAANSIRKPMLYPLSYEGLPCLFAQQAGQAWVSQGRAGCLAPDGLCRICAACRELRLPP